MAQRGVYRVNYYVNGQPKSSFVCAESDVAAANFLGVQDGSATSTPVAYPVEVVGIDAPHAAIPAIAPNVAPFEIPKGVTREEFNALQRQLADLIAAKK